MPRYTIDPELAGRLRELTPQELEQLEDNLVADGKVIDPIIVWNEFVLDGRHRLPIAERRGLPYEVVELALADRDQARIWVINHQLGKRNLTTFEQSQLRAEAARITGDTEIVAERNGVSRRTVQRDVETMEAMEKMSPDVRSKCESGAVINHKSDWGKYGKLSDEQRRTVDQKLRDGNITLRQALPRKEKDEIPLEMIEALNANKALTTAQKQGIFTERIHADKDSVEAFLALTGAQMEVVREILDDPEIDDLGDAILTLNSNGKPSGKQVSARVNAINGKISKRVDQIVDLIDELFEEYGNNSSDKDDCIMAIRHFQATWQAATSRHERS